MTFTSFRNAAAAMQQKLIKYNEERPYC
jgi:hypothetical protein